MKRIMNCQTMHCEPCKDEDAAIAYCKKIDTRIDGPWEFGERIGPGKRTDLAVACEMIRGGASLRDVAEQHMSVFVRACKGLTSLKCVLQVPRIQKRIAICLIGGTGVGKTYWAHHTLTSPIYTVFDPKTPWFDGYQGEDVVLFDDYGKNCMDINALKRFTDIYPVQVPIKGGALAWTPKLVVFTTNCILDLWYPDASPADIAALKRRITSYNYPDDHAKLMDDMDQITEDLGLQLRGASPPTPAPAAHAGPPADEAEEFCEQQLPTQTIPAPTLVDLHDDV